MGAMSHHTQLKREGKGFSDQRKVTPQQELTNDAAVHNEVNQTNKK